MLFAVVIKEFEMLEFRLGVGHVLPIEVVVPVAVVCGGGGGPLLQLAAVQLVDSSVSSCGCSFFVVGRYCATHRSLLSQQQ